MGKIYNSFVAIGLTVATSAALATPSYLVTHNTTGVESNAYVAGIFPSPRPTQAHSDGKVHWTIVRIACFGHTTNGSCPALVKMATNTKNPITLGWVSMIVDTGDITPKEIIANGYKLTVNGPGEVTLSEAP